MSRPTNRKQLLIVEDQRSRRAIILDNSFYLIGRSVDCDIVLNSPIVSRHHAHLIAIEEPLSGTPVYWIIDGGSSDSERSTNGLTINGTRQESHELKHGDTVIFGGGARAEFYQLSQTQAISIKECIVSEVSPFSSIVHSHPEADQDQSNDYVQGTVLIPPQKIAQDSEAELNRLASFPRLLPHPIIELDFFGQITYLNPVALIEFPHALGGSSTSSSHPLLAGFDLSKYPSDRSLIRRTLTVGDRIFDQSIHVLHDLQLVRIYSIEITERHKTEIALRNSEATTRALVEAMPDAMLCLSRDGTISDYHAPLDKSLPFDFSRHIGCLLTDCLYSSVADPLKTAIKQTPLQYSQAYVFELAWNTEDQDSIFEGRCVATSENEVLVILRDITNRKRVEQVIHQQVFRDGLTGVANRTAFDRDLALTLEQASQNGSRFGVMFADLDRFKTINDTLGHDVGDTIIIEFARRLEHCVRSSDIVARWGGDEFTILLPDMPNEQLAAEIASRILTALEEPFEIGGDYRPIKIGCSLGIAMYPAHGTDSRTLLKHADTALYHAKDSGRNVYKLFRSVLTEQVTEQASLEYAIQQALERDELSVYYQPQIDLMTGDVVSIEALLRWRHPHFGIVSPSRFIPIAEETGAIVPIGRWLITQACTQLKAWHAMGFPHLRVTINLSIRQFEKAGFCHTLERLLQDLEISPEFIELELTETVLAKNIDRAQSILKQLAQMGVHLALDDFGTGYSSLGYLKRFPVSALKIDRAFICNLHQDPRDIAIVSTIVALGRGLNLRVVAEGVETDEQVSLLQKLGCTHAQGYRITPPLATYEVAQFLFEHRWQANNSDEYGVVPQMPSSSPSDPRSIAPSSRSQPPQS
jgi:diguanylate cyclase (GGDEF)-like protein